jgi:hypothetical protein
LYKELFLNLDQIGPVLGLAMVAHSEWNSRCSVYFKIS